MSQPPALPCSYLALSALPLAPDCWTPLTGLRYQHRRSRYSDNSSSSTTSDSSSEYVYLLGGSSEVSRLQLVVTLSTYPAHYNGPQLEPHNGGNLLWSAVLWSARPTTGRLTFKIPEIFSIKLGECGGWGWAYLPPLQRKVLLRTINFHNIFMDWTFSSTNYHPLLYFTDILS